MTTKILALTDALGNLVRFVSAARPSLRTVALLRSSTARIWRLDRPTRLSTETQYRPDLNERGAKIRHRHQHLQGGHPLCAF